MLPPTNGEIFTCPGAAVEEIKSFATSLAFGE